MIISDGAYACSYGKSNMKALSRNSVPCFLPVEDRSSDRAIVDLRFSIGSRLLAIHEAALPTGRTDLQPQTNLTILDPPLPSAGKPCPASTRTY